RSAPSREAAVSSSQLRVALSGHRAPATCISRGFARLVRSTRQIGSPTVRKNSRKTSLTAVLDKSELKSYSRHVARLRPRSCSMHRLIGDQKRAASTAVQSLAAGAGQPAALRWKHSEATAQKRV